MRKIKLSYGLYALVDEENYEWLSQWKWRASFGSRDTKWYARRALTKAEGGGSISMHRQILGLSKGDPRVGDHLDDDGLDNRVENLAIITQKANMEKVPGWKKKGIKCPSASTN